MRIGLSTASFFKKKLTEDALSFISAADVPCCEVFLASFSEYKQSFAKQLAERKGNTEIVSVHTLNQQYEPELFNLVDRARKDSETILRRVARAAETVGARYYTFHGPAMLRRVSYHLDYERIGKRVEELCEFVDKKSGHTTALCYENVHWCYFSNPDFITRILPYAPSLKTCLDVKQAIQSGFSPEDYVKTMGERLTNVHLCDYNIDKTALPGQGMYDFERLFGILLENGYRGDAMIEVYSGDYDGYDELMTSYEYVNNCLTRALRAGV